MVVSEGMRSCPAFDSHALFRAEIMDRHGQSQSDRIKAFCDHLTGESDRAFIQKCQEFLTLMYTRQSLSIFFACLCTHLD